MSDYNYKIYNFINPCLEKIKDIKILEFGVKEGRSTKLCLDLCKKNRGKVYSVDIDDYSKIFEDENWIFIKSRDDNFEFLDQQLPQKFDVIYLDSLHEAKHVEKIFYHYFSKLEIGGFFFIDDISWLPYLKKKERNNFYCEINNQETFEKLLDIFSNNEDVFDLSFDFTSSGLCKIIKKKEILNSSLKVKTRKFTFKNFLRKIKLLIKS